MVLYANAMHQSGLFPHQVIDIKRDVVIQRQLALLLSNAFSLTVAIGGVGETETIEDLVPRVAADNLCALIEEHPEKFERTGMRAQARYHFIREN